MSQLKFLKPNTKNILLSIGLFILFNVLDIMLAIFGWYRGEGVGFPFKFSALWWHGLPASFFHYLYLIIDVLFFYFLSALFFQSKISKNIVIFILLTILIKLNLRFIINGF